MKSDCKKNDASGMALKLLEEWRRAGFIGDFTAALVESVLTTYKCTDIISGSAAVLLAMPVQALDCGHSCMNTADVDLAFLNGNMDGRAYNSRSKDAVPDISEFIEEWKNPEKCLNDCLDAGIVGKPGAITPFILDGCMLYLRRMFMFETNVAKFFSEKKAAEEVAVRNIDYGCLNNGQKKAVSLALTNKVMIITGGPGTGKTYTMAFLLKILKNNNPSLRICLAAPTGKAAMRMDESIREAIDENSNMHIPPAMTLHRLLGIGGQEIKNGALEADVVIIDEASMIDISIMNRLVKSLTPKVRLILLGDKNQLASVSPGCVLAELCAGREDLVAELLESRRFVEKGPVAETSDAVNRGDATAAWKCAEKLAEGFVPHKFSRNSEEFAKQIHDGFSDFMKETEPEKVLKALGKFRVLCATRYGAYGVFAINRIIETLLSSEKIIERFYDHRVIMVATNDYNVGLFNGDVGVILKDKDNGTYAFFEGKNGCRRIPCAMLPDHETAFAITVHKSQGSEFDDVAVVLPDCNIPILTRELVYTAITRTKRNVFLWSDEKIFKSSVDRRMKRFSGISNMIKRSFN